MANVSYQDAGRVGFVTSGDYNASATYNKLDVVKYDGISYICRVDGTTNIAPTQGSTTTNWQPITDRSGHDVAVRNVQNYPDTSEIIKLPSFDMLFFDRIQGVQQYYYQGKSMFGFISAVSISSAEWTAIQAIFNPSTTT